MICSLCNQPVVLIPSAQERADKYGGKASDYTQLFPQHATCVLEKRRRDTSELMARRRASSDR